MGEVKWQIGELGRVDEGGGGTIAYILAEKGVNARVIDMHTIKPIDRELVNVLAELSI